MIGLNRSGEFEIGIVSSGLLMNFISFFDSPEGRVRVLRNFISLPEDRIPVELKAEVLVRVITDLSFFVELEIYRIAFYWKKAPQSNRLEEKIYSILSNILSDPQNFDGGKKVFIELLRDRNLSLDDKSRILALIFEGIFVYGDDENGSCTTDQNITDEKIIQLQ